MFFLSALISGLAVAAFIAYIAYVRKTPEAKIRKKIDVMLEQSIAERLEEEKKHPKTRVVKQKVSVEDMTFYERMIQPMVTGIAESLHQLTPSEIIIMLDDYIFRAGKHGVWSVKTLAAAWVLSIVFGVLVALFVVQKTNLFFTQQIIVLAVGALIGSVFPFMVLKSHIAKRQKILKKELPEFLDLLCVSVQAGLSFDAAVAKIVTRMKGTLTEEFRHMQDDIRFGMTKQYALTQLAKRCDVEAIYLFTTSIIQAERLGTNMSQTLRVQADNMRERHRQFVKAEAMKAPVKIIFPMVLFIFPSVFVVLLFPAIISLMKNLG